MGSRPRGIDPSVAKSIALEINEAKDLGLSVAVMVGGGNIYRGADSGKDGIKEETGHTIGMLALCINCLALSDIFKTAGLDNIILSAYKEFSKIDSYSEEKGKKALEDDKVLLLAGGTGKPFCSTDTAAAIRAAELDADIIVKLTKVDGVYDSDPMTSRDAIKFDSLTFSEALEKNLKVMDREAFSICQESNIPIRVCKMEPGNIKRAVTGEDIGTIIR